MMHRDSTTRSAWLIALALAAFTVSVGADDSPRRLTLAEAREIALRSHPAITVADLKALAARQNVKQAQSGFFPNLSASVVAVGTAEDNTRLAAIGALNNPSIFERNAEGLTLTQLITDFGRTANLAGSAKAQAEAAANNAQATRDQIVLAVDSAFYSALQAQSVRTVAEHTVTNRQLFLEQVSIMSSNKLRSDLDVSFARVAVEEARLLLSRADNDVQAGFAQLSALLGMRDSESFLLVGQPAPSETDTNVSVLVEQALHFRPDLLSLRNQREAATKLARSEKAARYPTLSAAASAGVVPVHDPQLPDNYAAAGLILNFPLFAGGYYAARQHAAELQARAADAGVRDLENNIIRDVRIAWLNAQNAFDRYRITGHLLENARQSYTLAEARYQHQLSSIVEFNQAELNMISAEIAFATTEYEYLVRRSALSYQTGSLR